MDPTEREGWIERNVASVCFRQKRRGKRGNDDEIALGSGAKDNQDGSQRDYRGGEPPESFQGQTPAIMSNGTAMNIAWVTHIITA